MCYIIDIIHIRSSLLHKKLCMKIISEYICNYLQRFDKRLRHQEQHDTFYLHYYDFPEQCEENREFVETKCYLSDNYFCVYIDLHGLKRRQISDLAHELKRILEGEIGYIYYPEKTI